MASVYPSETGDTRERFARPGNDNARKHGLFAADPPPLEEVKTLARQAAESEDWHLLNLVARHLRERGLKEEGRKLARLARAGERKAALQFATNLLATHTPAS